METISETIYTQENWLQAYRNALSNATDEQIRKENREFYTHESQIIPDYLDYKEDWEHATDQMIQDLRKSYILRMATANQKMSCMCGKIHTLALYPNDIAKYTIVDDPKESPWTHCWFKTIDKEMIAIRNNLSNGTANFPSIISKNLTEIMQWQIAKTGNTPTLLPYDTYKEVWWDLDISGKTTEVALNVMKLMSQKSKEIIYNKHETIKQPDRRLYFFTTTEIIEDHAFHLFIRSRDKDMGEILKFLNKERRHSNWKGEFLKENSIKDEINKCKHCTKDSTKPNTSIFGIYCAPPGAGKSTAMRSGLLIGFDTDWIGVGANWRHYSPLLRRGIPIITNQTRLFQGSGIKIQLILKKSIRRDAQGKPMGNYKSILYWAQNNKDDVSLLLLKEKEFVTHMIMRAQIQAHMQNISLAMFLNKDSIWNVSKDETNWMNEFGKKMRRLAEGKYACN